MPSENQKSRTLYSANPVMFGARPFLFTFFLLLCPLGIGFILLLVWQSKCKAVRLEVTEDKITLEKGKFTRETNNLFHENIHSIKTNQTFIQRIFKIGDITILATDSADDMFVSNIPYPNKLKKLLEERHRIAMQSVPHKAVASQTEITSEDKSEGLEDS